MCSKSLIAVCIVTLLCLSSAAQIVTITHQGEALGMVNLISKDPLVMATTNVRGEADVSGLSDSKKIEVRLLGYAAIYLSYEELKAQNWIIELNKTNISLQEIQISATRWRQPSRESPERVTTITSEDVQLQNPQTAADLLAISGEVFIQKSQLGGGSPMIRGFSANRLLYSLDGTRMNTAIFRSGNLQNVISLDPFSISSTEVLFGPGSIMYGSDAIGAVMSFQTLEPQFSLDDKPLLTGKSIARYASASHERTMHFDVNIGWKKWALLSSFSSYQFDDLRMGSFGPDDYLRPFYVERFDTSDVIVTNDEPLIQNPSGYEQSNFMQKVSYQPNQNWTLLYAFHYSSTGDVPRYDRLIRTKNAEPSSAEWYYGPQVWMMNQFSIHHKQRNTFYDEVKMILAFQQFKESRIDRDFEKFVLSKRFEEVYALSANFDLIKNLSAGTRLFYGIELVSNDVNSKGMNENINSKIESVGPARYPISVWSSYAAYTTIQHDLTKKMVLQAGVRYSIYSIYADFNDNNDFYPLNQPDVTLENSAVTGSLGLVYRPSEKWSLTANISTGYRAPNVDDLGKVFDSEPGSVVVPNTALNAEYVYNAELGIAKVFGDVLKLDFTTYYTLLENAMVRRDFQIDGGDSIVYDGELSQVQAIQNAAESRVFGIQAGLEVKLRGGFSISSRFNYQKGEEELDNGDISPSRHAAPLFAIARLNYEYDKFRVQLYGNYTAAVNYNNLAQEERGKPYLYSRDSNGNPHAPAWYTLNFKVLYSLGSRCQISSGVENITDQRYRTYSSGIASAGRNFIMSLSADF